MIVLSEHNLAYPDVSLLPKETGTLVLCKLVQYQAKDENGVAIENEWRAPSYSSLFAMPVTFLGKTVTRTTWVTGQTQRTRTVQSVSLIDLSDDEILQLINDGHLYVYVDASDQSKPPMTVDEYRRMTTTGEVASPQVSAPIQTNQNHIQPG